MAQDDYPRCSVKWQMKGYRHNNMHLQRGAAIQRDKDRMFLLRLNLRNVNINMLSDSELKFLARHEAEHIRQFGHPSGGPDRTAAGHSNATIRNYHDLPYYVYTDSERYPDGQAGRTLNGDACWEGLPDVPAVDDERYPVNIDPNATGDEEYNSKDDGRTGQIEERMRDKKVPWSLSRGDWSFRGQWDA